MLNGQKYNFSTPVYSNITLVAKWKVDDKHLHVYKASVIKPTCSIEGYTIYTCFCGDSYSDNFIDALGHDIVRHNAKEPTASEFGWEEYFTCNRCDYNTYVELPKLGFTFGETVVDTVIFAKIPTSWEVAYCYFWGNEMEGPNNLDSGLKPSWPGYEMTLIDEINNIWAFIVPIGTANLIFNNGSEENTCDIEFVIDGNFYILNDNVGPDGKYTVEYSIYEYTGSLSNISKYINKAPL